MRSEAANRSAGMLCGGGQIVDWQANFDKLAANATPDGNMRRLGAALEIGPFRLTLDNRCVTVLVDGEYVATDVARGLDRAQTNVVIYRADISALEEIPRTRKIVIGGEIRRGARPFPTGCLFMPTLSKPLFERADLLDNPTFEMYDMCLTASLFQLLSFAHLRVLRITRCLLLEPVVVGNLPSLREFVFSGVAAFVESGVMLLTLDLTNIPDLEKITVDTAFNVGRDNMVGTDPGLRVSQIDVVGARGYHVNRLSVIVAADDMAALHGHPLFEMRVQELLHVGCTPAYVDDGVGFMCADRLFSLGTLPVQPAFAHGQRYGICLEQQLPTDKAAWLMTAVMRCAQPYAVVAFNNWAAARLAIVAPLWQNAAAWPLPAHFGNLFRLGAARPPKAGSANVQNSQVVVVCVDPAFTAAGSLPAAAPGGWEAAYAFTYSSKDIYEDGSMQYSNVPPVRDAGREATRLQRIGPRELFTDPFLGSRRHIALAFVPRSRTVDLPAARFECGDAAGRKRLADLCVSFTARSAAPRGCVPTGTSWVPGMRLVFRMLGWSAAPRPSIPEIALPTPDRRLEPTRFARPAAKVPAAPRPPSSAPSSGSSSGSDSDSDAADDL
jgi:hypothetical protein